LARPWALHEDLLGNLWIGTIDAGVWKYDGKDLTNYTQEDGLYDLAIWFIYRNRNGELWFVAGGEKVFKFNGKRFEELDVP
jgi:ligand-binding sensor domain-containing protein